MAKFLDFKDRPDGSVEVRSKRHKDLLGIIQYYPPWRKHVIDMESAYFDEGCLQEIFEKLREMDERRSK